MIWMILRQCAWPGHSIAFLAETLWKSDSTARRLLGVVITGIHAPRLAFVIITWEYSHRLASVRLALNAPVDLKHMEATGKVGSCLR